LSGVLSRFAVASNTESEVSGVSAAAAVQRISIVDSHTGGEPTRMVLSGGPELGGGPLSGRAEKFRREFDRFRSAIVNEPRGSDVMVGALLVEPHAPGCAAGVIFFNNVGTLGMCGHGTIGVMASLAHLGRIRPGVMRIDTPVGAVEAELHADGSVSVANVESWRKVANVAIDVPGFGTVHGDVAWGGNWFFLCEDHRQELVLAQVEQLTAVARAVRAAVNTQGFPEVDHVELCAPSATPGVSSRNFVLCPGGAYDRSPCGTGTSARLACLAAECRLAAGDEWVQESIVGSVFRARYRAANADRIVPIITGTAHVCGEGVLLLDPRDPFRWGIR
jgi:4-hydroxyproline epimerase